VNRSAYNGSVTGGDTTPGAGRERKTSEKTQLTSRQDVFSEQLSAIPELSSLSLGPLLKSSQPVELTESETEYVITCVKHIFRGHIVFQFDMTNTLNDQVLENAQVVFTVPEGYSQVASVSCPRLVYNEPGRAYTVLEITAEAEEDYNGLLGSLESVILKYKVKDCDPNTGEVEDDEGYDDEYALEDVDIGLSDFFQRAQKKATLVLLGKKRTKLVL